MRFATFSRLIVLCLVYPWAGPAVAMETVYQSPQECLGESLPGCQQQALWLGGEAKSEIEQSMGQPIPGMRVR